LFGKPEGKRSLGRPRHRWEDNIRMHLREIGLEVTDWVWLRVRTSGGPFEHGDFHEKWAIS
jgi:hypothetical protein